MDDTLTAHLKLAEYYNVPVPPYPMPTHQIWVVSVQDGLVVRDARGNRLYAIPYMSKVIILGEIDGKAEIAPGEWVSKAYLKQV